MDNSSLAHPEFEVTTTVSPRGSRNQDSTIVHKSLTFDPLPIQKCEFVLFNVIGWFMVLFMKKVLLIVLNQWFAWLILF